MINEEEMMIGEDIAIIGMSGRFPGADGISALWENIKDGVESITQLTEEDLKATGIKEEIYNDPCYVRAEAAVENIDEFDADFFDCTPREAQILNPQHRMFLQYSWKALEDAGYNPEMYEGRIGVYAGEGFNKYFMDIANNKEENKWLNEMQVLMGNDKDFLATQVSYKLGLTGPSMTVQSGCSTSLLAIALATQGLNNYQCDIALAGGVRLGIPQKTGYLYKEGSILSPDGHCRPFDEAANGTVGGSGLGIVVLKRLEDALKDKDHIYAVIKGTAINNDGNNKIGYTAPSIDGQADAIYEALQVAGIKADEIGYIETHGTGTNLGDPIEFSALNKVFQRETSKRNFCALGSVKANIGHLDAAAGVTGVIKTALMLMHKVIPPMTNFNKPNPKLDIENSAFYIPKNASEWVTDGTPRRAGVSSFGIGGTNVHIVLEEAPYQSRKATYDEWQILPLSAKQSNALESMSEALKRHLEENPSTPLNDVAYTLQYGRKVFDYRQAIICKNTLQAVDVLKKAEPYNLVQGKAIGATKPNTVFMFSGQGSQYIGMGKELYETNGCFREIIDHCCEQLEGYLGIDLRKIMYDVANSTEDINQTYLAQPALFVTEYALASTLIHYGVMPAAMIGHSIGEYVAACLAGVFTLEEALPLVVSRGRLMQGQLPGAMTSVALSEEKVQPFLNHKVSIATVNAPDNVVVAGEFEAVEALEEKLKNAQISSVRLHTSHAFHSYMMEECVSPFMDKFLNVHLNKPNIPIVSNVTGDWLKDEEATSPEYWGKHLMSTVKFSNGISKLLSESEKVFIEIGPGNTLCKLTKQHLASDTKSCTIQTMRHIKQNVSDKNVLYKALGESWVHGLDINWQKVNLAQVSYKVSLPTYSFDQKTYWLGRNQKAVVEENQKPIKSNKIDDWFYMPYWSQTARYKKTAIDEGCWVIFASDSPVTSKIETRLLNHKCPVVKVYSGKNYEVIDDYTYMIDINDKVSYRTLFETLEEKELLPRYMVHMWSLNESITQNGPSYVFKSLLYIAQVTRELNILSRMNLSVITQNAYALHGEMDLDINVTALLGITKTIPQEYMNIICSNIDFSRDELEKYDYAQAIIDETIHTDDIYEIAYRYNKRFIKKYEQVQLEQSDTQSALVEKGVYLITGGLGNIGRNIAKRLAEKYQATLILTGRSKIDAFKQSIIDELKSLGSEVRIYEADVTNRDEMQNVVTKTIDEFGKINGIIHAAGIVGTETYQEILQIGESQIKQQMDVKIEGVRILNQVTKDLDVDLYILMSSLSTILGGPGLTTYASANACMSSLAQYYSLETNKQWISIEWDGWYYGRNERSRDGLEIDMVEGVEAFERICTNPYFNQIIVSVGPLNKRIKQWINANHAISIESKEEKVGQESVEEIVTRIWKEMLGVEEVKADDNFFEVGGDSLVASQMIYRIRAELQLDISIKAFFETPTMRFISETIKSYKEEQDKLMEALELVKGLSDEEIQKLLQDVEE